MFCGYHAQNNYLFGDISFVAFQCTCCHFHLPQKLVEFIPPLLNILIPLKFKILGVIL